MGGRVAASVLSLKLRAQATCSEPRRPALGAEPETVLPQSRSPRVNRTVRAAARAALGSQAASPTMKIRMRTRRRGGAVRGKRWVQLEISLEKKG